MFLREKGFQYAIAGSLLWHFFWLFVVAVNFSGGAVEARKNTRIYFIGPVLSDHAFNVLLSNKPEMSQTIYRTLPEIEETLEPEIENLGRQSPGDAVSVPTGRSSWSHLQGVLRASAPGHHDALFYEKFQADIAASPFPVSGDLQKRDILYLPDLPLAASAAREGAPSGEAVFKLTVSADGKVTRAENTVSSGDASLDLVWQKYLEGWQFLPLEGGSGPDQTGQVRLRPLYSGKLEL